MSSYPGIDYSGPFSTANRDAETGIRYGIIPLHALNEYAIESFEPDYGTPHCPKCGNDAITIPSHSEQREQYVTCIQDVPEAYEDYEIARHECEDFACESCKYLFGSESAYADEPIGNTLDNGEYQGNLDDSNDVWIFKSPYYTHAQFCSPCAPGAGYLANPCEDGPKTYCLGHEWFEDGTAPYPVYRVDTGEIVCPEGYAIRETVDGQFMVLRNGFQIGGTRDKSGAGNATYATQSEAYAALLADKVQS